MHPARGVLTKNHKCSQMGMLLSVQKKWHSLRTHCGLSVRNAKNPQWRHHICKAVQFEKYTQEYPRNYKKTGQGELYHHHKDARGTKHTSKRCFKQVHRPESAYTNDDILTSPPPPPSACQWTSLPERIMASPRRGTPHSEGRIMTRGLLSGWLILYLGGGGLRMGGWVCLAFPDFGKSAGTPPPLGGCQLFWVGGWVGGLLSCCSNGIPLCICLPVARFVCA